MEKNKTPDEPAGKLSHGVTARRVGWWGVQAVSQGPAGVDAAWATVRVSPHAWGRTGALGTGQRAFLTQVFLQLSYSLEMVFN